MPDASSFPFSIVIGYQIALEPQKKHLIEHLLTDLPVQYYYPNFSFLSEETGTKSHRRSALWALRLHLQQVHRVLLPVSERLGSWVPSHLTEARLGTQALRIWTFEKCMWEAAWQGDGGHWGAVRKVAGAALRLSPGDRDRAALMAEHLPGQGHLLPFTLQISSKPLSLPPPGAPSPLQGPAPTLQLV